MRIWSVLAFLAWSVSPAVSLEESAVQACICKQGRQEVATQAGTFVDCLTGRFAIEVDPSERWAEALGQALHYALESKRAAKVVLYCDSLQDDDARCYRHALRLEATIRGYNLPVTVELHDAASLVKICP